MKVATDLLLCAGAWSIVVGCGAGDDTTAINRPPTTRHGAKSHEDLGEQVQALTESAGAVAVNAPPVPVLEWEACAEGPDAQGFECARAEVPRDYTRPHGPRLSLALTRLPATDSARRIGSLFVNFGGPGGEVVGALHGGGAELFTSLNDRFDIVGFDPRGVGQTEGAIDCAVTQESEGLYAQPFVTPQNLDRRAYVRRARSYVDACVRNNGDTFRDVATASVARDMDLLREALGEEQLSYLGFSYGTFLGATYASLFPHNYRALVLDGAVDADTYINHPMDGLLAQSAGFERALDRFFQACAADRAACLGFGGDDPHRAFDELVARASVAPLTRFDDPTRSVDGDDILSSTVLTLYAKERWPLLARALSEAATGEATLFGFLTDAFYGRLADGSYDPSSDRYFTLGAAEQSYDADVDTFIDGGHLSWSMFDHAWWNAGYVELPLGLFPIEARGVFRGPFHVPASAQPILVVGTTFDPATPYRSAELLVEQLENAQLLTMNGDGHCAYGGRSTCIDAAIDRYLEEGTLPPAGSECDQEVPFAQPEPVAAPLAAGGAARALFSRGGAFQRPR
jgi:pimeloyl-ACP methyl ester carboxylesterase